MDLSKLSDDQLAIAAKVAAKAEEKGLNPDFVLPMVMQESGFDPNARSKKGAMSVMQIMPSTAEAYHCKDPSDVDQNIDCGLNILSDLISKKHIGNDPYKVLAAYNAGPNTSFFKTGKIEDLPEETINHMAKVSDIYGDDLPSPSAIAGQQEPASEDAQSSAAAEPIVKTNVDETVPERYPSLSPKQRTMIGGMTGLAVGTGATGAIKTAKFLNEIKNRVSGKATPGDIGGMQDPELGQSKTIDENLQEPSFGNTDVQNERIMKGGEGSTEGTTGRARQTGYNIHTAQEAASKKAADQVAELMRRTGMSDFDAAQFLAKQPGLTASPAGVIYPKSAARQTIGARTYTSAPVGAQAAQTGSPTIGSAETPVIGGANAATAQTSPLPVTSTASVAPQESALSKLSQNVKNAAKTVGHVMAPVARIGVSGLGGALAANQLYEAEQDRRIHGWTPENIMDYLSAAGGALSMVPTGGTQAAGLALQAPALAYGAYKQMKKPETYKAYADPANIGMY
jgi:hypothetical protein